MIINWLIQGNHNNLYDAKKSNLASVRMRAAITSSIDNKNIIAELYNKDVIINKNTVVGIGKLSHDDNEFKKWLYIAQYTKSQGGKVFLDFTDNHLLSSSPLYSKYCNIIKHCTHATTSSYYLKKTLGEYFKGCVTVIEDPLEIDPMPPRNKYNDVLTGLWFGHASNINFLLNFLIEKVKVENKLKFIVMTNINSNINNIFKDVRKILPAKIELILIEWSIIDMQKAARHSDFAILPTDPNDPRKAGVSSNRLITALSLGLPCFANIVESYNQYSKYAIPIDTFESIDFTFHRETFANIEYFQKHISPIYSRQAMIRKWEDFFKSIL